MQVQGTGQQGPGLVDRSGMEGRVDEVDRQRGCVAGRQTGRQRGHMEGRQASR